MNTTTFGFTVTRGVGVCIVYLSGEIDYAASLEMAPQLDDLTRDSDADLFFDLTDVTLIDSEGIKLLLLAVERVRRMEHRSQLIRCSPRAERIMKLAGVEDYLASGDGMLKCSWSDRLSWQRPDRERTPQA